jgi:predicted Fe-Mo cluster-binding NifX family protein
MKIVVPLLEKKGRGSMISMHFGRAPYFAVYSTDKDSLEIVDNRSRHSGGRGTLAREILQHRPDVVFVLDLGPKAIELFGMAGVGIRTGDFKTLAQVIENIYNLKELEEGCKEHKH